MFLPIRSALQAALVLAFVTVPTLHAAAAEELLPTFPLAPSSSAVTEDAGRDTLLSPQVSSVNERVDWIQRQLDERRTYTAVWKYGFMGVFGAAAIFQGVSYFYVEEEELKNDALVGAVMAGLGVGGMVISPVDGGEAATELSDYSTAVTAPVARLAYAEKLLYETSLGEQSGRDWFQYAQMFIASSTSAGVMLFHYDQPLSAVVKFVSGVGASTARILMTPTSATEAWEAYRARFSTHASHAHRVPVKWGLDVRPETIALRIDF